jgi:hypothetical protein
MWGGREALEAATWPSSHSPGGSQIRFFFSFGSVLRSKGDQSAFIPNTLYGKANYQFEAL